MAKIAIISDIHANVLALKKVLKDAEKRGVTRFICLGDLVVKNFYPAEVVDAIKANVDVVVQGNLDLSVVTNLNFRFARSKLGLSRLEYLANLPKVEQLLISGALVNFFHATPNSLDDMYNPLFSNEMTAYKDKKTASHTDMFFPGVERQQISICGHTHQEYVVYDESEYDHSAIAIFCKEPIKLMRDSNIILNAGSVGDSLRMIEHRDHSYSEKLNNYMTYLTLEGELNSEKISDINIEIVRLQARDVIRSVFVDSVAKQNSGEFPYSPSDTERIAKGLKEMGARKLPTLKPESEVINDEFKRGR